VLAWDSTSADQDHLTLVVDGPATIELALLLPPVTRLAVTPGMRRLEILVDGVRASAVAAPRVRVDVPLAGVTLGADARAVGRVDATTALVAVATPPPIFSMDHPRDTHFSVDKSLLRRAMKGARNRLEHCWLRVAQYDPRIEGTTTLHFVVELDGTIETVTTDGELPDVVTSCLAADVRTWKLPEGDTRVVVNYPLTFRLNR
jgi:hypothetical protein